MVIQDVMKTEVHAHSLGQVILQSLEKNTVLILTAANKR